MLPYIPPWIDFRLFAPPDGHMHVQFTRIHLKNRHSYEASAFEPHKEIHVE